MPEQPPLEALQLVKRYGDRLAVDGVDLQVRAGEVHGLLGPNAAGKTTVLRIVLGLVHPDGGLVRVLGRRRPGHGGGRGGLGGLPRGVAGFVDPVTFYPYLSGRRNLRLLSRLDGASATSRAAERRVDEVLEGLGLSSHGDVRIDACSAGTRQRLGLAAALLRMPKLLILDEPTRSLDPAAARDVRARLKALAASGTAVLVSSHDLAEVEEVCGRLTVLGRGRTLFSGTVEGLRQRSREPAQHLHTADDERARAIGQSLRELQVTPSASGFGLDVRGSESALDAYVVALGKSDLPVRRLERRVTSLEEMFLELTTDTGATSSREAAGRVPSQADPGATLALTRQSAGLRLAGVWASVGVECSKLAAQRTPQATLILSVASPFVFILALEAQGNLPEDTLFGRWATSSGFAVPLVVLGYASAWGLGLLCSLVAGDVFSSEDRQGTWPALLTRARSVGEIFTGKVLTALAFSTLAVSLLALSSVAAGLLVVGRQALLGLSGTLVPPERALALVAFAWASVLPPAFAFSALAVLVSVVTRNGVAGVGLPVLLGLLLEACSYWAGADGLRRGFFTSALAGWHGLFTEPRSYETLAFGTAASAVTLAVCLAGARAVTLRRDFGN